MKETARDIITELGYSFKEVDNELDVYLPDVDFDSLTEDPDVLLCEHYSLPWDEVNCIELAV
tara:strand:+ start:245 stop:430 length:186 start_codon:yes stop_codon:yes gene_type:complete